MFLQKRKHKSNKPYYQKNSNSNSKMSNTRNLNIQLCICSLRELYQLTNSFRVKEKSEAFIVRFGMMKSLAKDALAYSLKVSCLDERREYSIIADILDNIYIRISRSGLRRIASEYEDIVLCKFDAMYEVLGMIDERLKTVHIVSNRYAKQRDFVSNNAGLRKTPYSVSPVFEDSVIEPEEEETRTTHLKHMVRAYTKRRESEKLKEEKDRELKEFTTFMETNFAVLNHLNYTHIPGLTHSEAFKRKLETICEIFNYIKGKAVYIATNYLFRKPTKKSGFSFMQHAIRKCPFLIENIENVYDNIRYSVTRIDPELRREKRNTIDLLKTVQDILCKLYTENSNEKESVQTLLKMPQ